MVAALCYNSLDANAGDQHGADAAGLHGAVERRAVQGQTIASRLADGILLGVNGAHAMLPDGAILVDSFLHEMADFVAVGEARRRADIPGADDALVADDDATAAASVAGGAAGDLVDQVDEVLVPAGTGSGGFGTRFGHLDSSLRFSGALYPVVRLGDREIGQHSERRAKHVCRARRSG